VRRILIEAPAATVLFTEGRRPRWTQMLKARLQRKMGPLGDRVVFLPRQKPGDDYLRLLGLADVLLHPFPFGGSRTSADGLALGVPVVTKPTKYLRCRMAASFYASMGLTGANWTLVAHSTDAYVDFVAKLANDDDHRAAVAHAVRSRQDVIWEDASVVDEWAQLLARVTGRRLIKDQRLHERPPSATAVDAHDLAVDARRLYDAGRLAESAGLLETLVRACYEAKDAVRCPDEAKAKSDLGAVYQQAGRFAAAEAALRASVALNPNNSIALNNLAVTYVSLGRPEDAEPYYAAALETARNDASPYTYPSMGHS